MRATRYVLLLVLFPLHALAWGSKGHAVVAELAERGLSPNVAAQIRQLNFGAPLRDVASLPGVKVRFLGIETNLHGERERAKSHAVTSRSVWSAATPVAAINRRSDAAAGGFAAGIESGVWRRRTPDASRISMPGTFTSFT